MKPSKSLLLGFWIFTALFCLEMTFTAYWELLRLPDAAHAFARLGFPAASFRAELSLAKIAGVIVLLIPTLPARLKEWAYAGFAFNLVSALIAHFSIHDRHLAFVPSTITSVLWLGSYLCYHRLQAHQDSLILWRLPNSELPEPLRPFRPGHLRPHPEY